MPRLLSFALLLAAATFARAQAPDFPKPEKEHEWLHRFVGEWKTQGEADIPGQPPLKCEGTETVRSLGGFWTVSELRGNMPGTEVDVTGVMTLGYDPAKKKYVGTWIDSATSHMWRYEGTVDPAGKVLTLEAEGPNMLEPGKTAKYRDVVEFKSDDHRVLTSSVLGPDGQWTTFMTSHARRIK